MYIGPEEQERMLQLMWAKQCLLTKEKLQALEKLIKEQLDVKHIKETTSP